MDVNGSSLHHIVMVPKKDRWCTVHTVESAKGGHAFHTSDRHIANTKQNSAPRISQVSIFGIQVNQFILPNDIFESQLRGLGKIPDTDQSNVPYVAIDELTALPHYELRVKNHFKSFLASYGDLSWPLGHPKCWFDKGISPRNALNSGLRTIDR